MGEVWLRSIKKEIRQANGTDSLYRPWLREILPLMEKRKAEVQPYTYKFVLSLVLSTAADVYPFPETERELMMKGIRHFIKRWPGSPYNYYLVEEYGNQMRSGMDTVGFTLKDMQGKDVSLSDFKGKYVLLDVWGSWCLPSRRRHKELLKLYERYKDSDNIVFLSVAYDKDTCQWEKAVLEDKLKWTQLRYTDKFLDDWNVIAYPEVFFISPGQVILERHTDRNLKFQIGTWRNR
jgi:thiol-disulfide isomerase/thioredoxin